MYIADGDYIKDIEVNDLRNRYMLTKGATQKMVIEILLPQSVHSSQVIALFHRARHRHRLYTSGVVNSEAERGLAPQMTPKIYLLNALV